MVFLLTVRGAWKGLKATVEIQVQRRGLFPPGSYSGTSWADSSKPSVTSLAFYKIISRKYLGILHVWSVRST